MALTLVEFVGLPGAGKTTTANALRSIVREADGVRVLSRSEFFTDVGTDDQAETSYIPSRLRWLLADIFSEPVVARHLVRALVPSFPVSLTSVRRARMVLRAAVVHAQAAERLSLQSATIVCDQGWLQDLAAFRQPLRSTRALPLHALVQHVVRRFDYRVAFFCVPIDEAVERLAARRDHTEFERMLASRKTGSRHAARRALLAMHQHLSHLVEVARMARASVLTLDALDTPTQRASAVAQWCQEGAERKGAR